MTCSVIIDGRALPGLDGAVVRARLATLIGQGEEVAGALLAGTPRIVKSGIDEATALRYVQALRRIGVSCRLQPATRTASLRPSAAAAGASPRPGSLRASHACCRACGAVVRGPAALCEPCAGRLRAVSLDARSGGRPEGAAPRADPNPSGRVSKWWARSRDRPAALVPGLVVVAVLALLGAHGPDAIRGRPSDRSAGAEAAATSPRPATPVTRADAAMLGHLQTRNGTVEITGRRVTDPDRVVMVFTPGVPRDEDPTQLFPQLVELAYGVRPSPTIQAGRDGLRIVGDAPRQFMLFQATEGDRIVGVAVSPG